MSSQLMNIEAAKAAAKRLFQKVNYQGGSLQNYELSSLLQETYDYLKIPFKPTPKDVKSYGEVLDVNKDGQVTLTDLESIAVQFLCGPNVLPNKPAQNQIKYEEERNSNVRYGNITNSVNSYESSQNVIGSQQVQHDQLHLSNQNTYLNNPNYNLTSNPVYLSPSNKYAQEQQYQAQSSARSSNSASRTPSQYQNEEKRYNQRTVYYLTITKEIFQKYARQDYTITAREVPDLLSETYETLGRKGYHPNEEDVKVWMKLCDGNGDGRVELEEYEYFVVRSLERSGFELYD